MDLPDGRSWTAEQLELMRKVAVRAVLELGHTRRDVAEMLGVNENTVGEWCADYELQGEDAFTVETSGRKPGSGRSLSPEEEEEIRSAVINSLPADHDIPASRWTRATVGELIRRKLNIDLSLQGVGNYLKRWELTPQKPARHAREADADEIEEFVNETLPEIVEKAEKEDAELHFCDEAGFEATDQIGRSYAPCGETPILPIPKVRIAQNMVASITPEGELTWQLYSGTMDAQRFIEWLELLVSQAERKIFLFLDRLTSHTANAVEEWLSDHNEQIEVVWLPRYSPEHNPAEFLNNDVKQTLKNEPLPQDTSDFRSILERLLDSISEMPARIQAFFDQAPSTHQLA